MALAYATRYRLRDVFLGIGLAVAAILLISVAFGRLVGLWLPHGYVEALSAACFIGFAVWTLYGDDKSDQIREDRRHPILIIGFTFFLAEFGDKTMFSTATLAAAHSWFPVWVGATAGMVLSDALAVWVGRSLGKRIPEKTVRWIAAGFFFLFGCWSAVQAVAAFR